jgi:hypothetical protein
MRLPTSGPLKSASTAQPGRRSTPFARARDGSGFPRFLATLVFGEQWNTSTTPCREIRSFLAILNLPPSATRWQSALGTAPGYPHAPSFLGGSCPCSDKDYPPAVTFLAQFGRGRAHKTPTEAILFQAIQYHRALGNAPKASVRPATSAAPAKRSFQATGEPEPGSCQGR